MLFILPRIPFIFQPILVLFCFGLIICNLMWTFIHSFILFRLVQLLEPIPATLCHRSLPLLFLSSVHYIFRGHHRGLCLVQWCAHILCSIWEWSWWRGPCRAHGWRLHRPPADTTQSWDSHCCSCSVSGRIEQCFSVLGKAAKLKLLLLKKKENYTAQKMSVFRKM